MNSAKPKIRIPSRRSIDETRTLLQSLGLHTVCQEADCPNRWECFGNHTATFLIMGDVCTRHCTFCNIGTGTPLEIDPDEPENVAEAAAKLILQYIVITSVTRDDLPDGGANHFAETVMAVRARLPETGIEVLTPDFQGDVKAIETVLDAKPTVFNHNIETVERLTPELRNKASYLRSLAVLSYAARYAPDIPVKSGFMVGVGETEEEVRKALEDLRAAGCSILTIGQYLAPSDKHYPVQEYITEDTFQIYRTWAEELKFKAIAAAPLVRSSYQAGKLRKAVG
jgi:lipoic acid synthetase